MEPLMEIEGLAKRYDDFSLDNVSLVVQPGLVVGMVGPNGAGKTTVLKAMLGLIAPDAGTIRLFGSQDIDRCKERIGVVFDTCPFLGSMSVRDVARLGKAVYHSWDPALFEGLCRQFDLAVKKRVEDLSRGMGMKLSLAFALAHHPDLLVLDEATAGLDPMARDEVLDILRHFMEDDSHGILMATHITSDLEKMGDEILCIDKGAIVFDEMKDAISDIAGIAHCRTSDSQTIAAAAFPGRDACKAMQRGLSIDILVPDRFDFAKRFPAIAVERASVENYMAFMLKGESL